MIILGIDPGIAVTGYGIINQKGYHHEMISYGTIKTSSKEPLSKRLFILSTDLTSIFTKYKPDVVSVEDLFFNRNVSSAIVVGQARGIVLLSAEQHQCEVFNYTPTQVKQGICGYGRAEKHQIQYMVKTMLRLPQIPRPVDAADALALAICHALSYKIKSLA